MSFVNSVLVFVAIVLVQAGYYAVLINMVAIPVARPILKEVSVWGMSSRNYLWMVNIGEAVIGLVLVLNFGDKPISLAVGYICYNALSFLSLIQMNRTFDRLYQLGKVNFHDFDFSS